MISRHERRSSQSTCVVRLTSICQSLGAIPFNPLRCPIPHYPTTPSNIHRAKNTRTPTYQNSQSTTASQGHSITHGVTQPALDPLQPVCAPAHASFLLALCLLSLDILTHVRRSNKQTPGLLPQQCRAGAILPTLQTPPSATVTYSLPTTACPQ